MFLTPAVGFPELQEPFLQRGISGEDLLYMQKEDLHNLGIPAGTSRLLLTAVNKV
jgi:hypothetical protein